MRRPVLIVIAGPNGSGKTSTTRLVIKHELFRTIDGKFAKQYIDTLPAWTRDILDSVKE